MDELMHTMQNFKKRRIGSILCYSVEADIEDESKSDLDEIYSRAAEFINEQKVIVSNVKILGNSEDCFIAIKLTAIYPPSWLLRYSKALIDGTALSERDLLIQNKIYPMLQEMCNDAVGSEIKFIIDAEQTYFQNAIDEITIQLTKEFNKDHAMIYNSYQSYRIDSSARLAADFKNAVDNNYVLGIKIVRGAYMAQENNLAIKEGRQSPIHPTIEETHNCYNSNIKFAIKALADNQLKKHVGLLIASHNKNSVQIATELMEEYSVDKQQVAFGQLMGMRDEIAHYLSEAGYRIFKVVPYGPMISVMPYLHRRGQENQQMLLSLADDSKLVTDAIKWKIGFKSK